MRFLVVAASAIFITSPAMAAKILVEFTGENSSPDAANVFGTPVPTVSGSLVYDTDRPATPFTSTQARYEDAIVEFNFDLGSGITGGFERDSGFGRAQVANLGGADRISFGNFAFGPGALENEPAGTNFYSFTVSFSGPNSVFGTEALSDLPGPFDPDLFDTSRLQLFVNQTGQSGVAVNFNFNFTDVTVTELQDTDVPAPPALALLGLGALGAAGARHSRKASRSHSRAE
ncbi:MAG: PEP-CTERM sorting domain-containing protein [Pacificimonas sp.]|jgi:hypothetical protein|nr:PEP-CTERM sorting domain-containing protein [Pacificimonas sp.]